MTMTPGGGARAGGSEHMDRGPAYGAPDPGTGYAHAAPIHHVYATDAARPVWPAVLHGAGALASLALVVGIGVWGYGQVKRDVSGVPVVRALEGPMRMAPDRPGGQISDHVGLAVNAVKAGGTEAPIAETLVLAPEESPLAPEDRPAPDLAPRRAPDAAAVPAPGPTAPAQEEAPAPLPLVEARLEGSVPAAALSNSEDGPVQAGAAENEAAESVGGPAGATVESTQPHAAAIAEALAGAGIAPLEQPAAEQDTAGTGAETAADTGAETATDTGASTEAGADPAPRVAAETAPAAGLRPAPRPATRLETLERDGSFLRLAAAEEAELPHVPPGTRLVQLGAFDSIAEARTGWAEVQARFGQLMDGKARVLQQAEAGGRTFWRLRAAGFDDLAQARRFCAALVAEQADCIPVVAR